MYIKIFRKILAFAILALSVMCCSAQTSIYSYSVVGANGQAYPLSSFQGQKLMIVVLTPTQTSTDSAFLNWVDSIALAHQGGLKVIVVPSFEDGYTADSANTMMTWYAAALDSSITISQPLYTHKTSGAQQDSVFQWLTNDTMNVHFNDDVAGAGSMYFVDGQGNLYWVFDPGAMFSNKSIAKVLP